MGTKLFHANGQTATTKLIVAFRILANAPTKSRLLTGFPLTWLKSLNFYPLKCSFGRPLDSANRGGSTTRPPLATPPTFQFLFSVVSCSRPRHIQERSEPLPTTPLPKSLYTINP